LVAYAQLPRPNGIREGSMPYTAWKYMAQTSSSTGMDLFCYNWVLYHITCSFTRVTNYEAHRHW